MDFCCQQHQNELDCSHKAKLNSINGYIFICATLTTEVRMAETSCSAENDILNAKQPNSLYYDDDDILCINARVSECGKCLSVQATSLLDLFRLTKFI